MNDYDLLEKMIEASSAYVKNEITSKECSAKMASSLNAYKEQLNIAFVSQQRELFVSFARFAHNYGKGSYGNSYEEMFSEWMEKRNK